MYGYVYPEIYHDYKNLYIEIIMHINHLRMNALDDENWINNIHKLIVFFQNLISRKSEIAFPMIHQ